VRNNRFCDTLTVYTYTDTDIPPGELSAVSNSGRIELSKREGYVCNTGKGGWSGEGEQVDESPRGEDYPGGNLEFSWTGSTGEQIRTEHSATKTPVRCTLSHGVCQ